MVARALVMRLKGILYLCRWPLFFSKTSVEYICTIDTFRRTIWLHGLIPSLIRVMKSKLVQGVTFLHGSAGQGGQLGSCWF